jgi:hypothetical protein
VDSYINDETVEDSVNGKDVSLTQPQDAVYKHVSQALNDTDSAASTALQDVLVNGMDPQAAVNTYGAKLLSAASMQVKAANTQVVSAIAAYVSNAPLVPKDGYTGYGVWGRAQPDVDEGNNYRFTASNLVTTHLEVTIDGSVQAQLVDDGNPGDLADNRPIKGVLWLGYTWPKGLNCKTQFNNYFVGLRHTGEVVATLTVNTPSDPDGTGKTYTAVLPNGGIFSDKVERGSY